MLRIKTNVMLICNDIVMLLLHGMHSINARSFKQWLLARMCMLHIMQRTVREIDMYI